MPIKTAPSEEIPYLSNYRPYSIGTEVLAENINEMFSYNIVPNSQPTNIDYYFGIARDAIVTNLAFNNLTKNATLSFEFLYDGAYMNVVTGTRSGINNAGKTTSAILLEPGQTKIIIVLVDKDKMQPEYQNILTNCEVRVQYLPTGELVFRNLAVSPLALEVLPNTITFYN